jgi:hypothetical protein
MMNLRMTPHEQYTAQKEESSRTQTEKESDIATCTFLFSPPHVCVVEQESVVGRKLFSSVWRVILFL